MDNTALKDYFTRINAPEMMAIQRIQTVLLHELKNYAFNAGFIQLMPVLLSPITDPLNHEVYPAEINYEDRQLKLTASMIFHKQVALSPENMKKILIIAPNIRLELAKKKSSDNHLLEFSQFDIEMKDASMFDVMNFLQGVYHHVFNKINQTCSRELEILGRKLPTYDTDFPCVSTVGVPLAEVDQFCDNLSAQAKTPTFVTSFKREFYDKEDPENPGTYLNFDILYPDGYGEGLSGAEREYEHDDIVRRMNELDMDLDPYANYLQAAKEGKLPRTAGAGIGIQRLLKFICGRRDITDVCLFDRSMKTEFIF